MRSDSFAQTAHLRVRSDAPQERTVHAFILAGWKILDDEVRPPFWLPPVDVQEAGSAMARYWERHNSYLEAVTATLESCAVRALQLAGLPPELLAVPRGPRVQCLIDALVEGQRSNLQLLDELLPSRPMEISASWAVVAGACMYVRAGTSLTNNQVHRRAAELLNRGIPANRKAEGLQRDHVYRAELAYLKTVVRATSSIRGRHELQELVLDSELQETRDRFAALKLIHDKAKEIPEFKGMAGAELAHEVHRRRDLYVRFDKALAYIQRSNSAW